MRILAAIATLLLLTGVASAQTGTGGGPANGGGGGSGTVTSVATTSPITGGPISTTGTVSCPTCVTSAAALTSNAIMLGAGSQASSVLASLGTATTVLHGNASGAPTFGAVVLTTDVSGNLPNANLASQTANTVLGSLTATTPSGLAVPSCSGATSALIWTTGTGFGCNTISAGGLPTGTTGQTIYYAASGTTGTATSAVLVSGATSGSPVGIGTTAPIDTLDVLGSHGIIGSGPSSNTTTNGALAAAATTMTVVSTTGYPASGGYLWLGNGSQFHGEVASYTGTTATTFTGLTRGMFSTTANASLTTGSFVQLISYFDTDSLTGAVTYAKLWNGGVLHWPGGSTGLWSNGSAFGTNSEVFGGPVLMEGALTMSNAAITGATSVGSALYDTTTNCGAVGTSASPSLVACAAAPAGAFSCAVTATAGTCTVATTAVTAASEIHVWLVADEGTRLGVTCNTTATANAAPLLATKTAGTGFTINMPTITTNPACYDYLVVN